METLIKIIEKMGVLIAPFNHIINKIVLFLSQYFGKSLAHFDIIIVILGVIFILCINHLLFKKKRYIELKKPKKGILIVKALISLLTLIISSIAIFTTTVSALTFNQISKNYSKKEVMQYLRKDSQGAYYQKVKHIPIEYLGRTQNYYYFKIQNQIYGTAEINVNKKSTNSYLIESAYYGTNHNFYDKILYKRELFISSKEVNKQLNTEANNVKELKTGLLYNG